MGVCFAVLSTSVNSSIAACVDGAALSGWCGAGYALAFIVRESPVRSVTEGEVRSTVSADGHCSSCDAQMAADLEFCPLCGKFE